MCVLPPRSRRCIVSFTIYYSHRLLYERWLLFHDITGHIVSQKWNFFQVWLTCKTFALIIFKIYVTRNYFYNIVPNPITKLRISYAVTNKQQTHTTRTKCQTYVGTCTDSFCSTLKSFVNIFGSSTVLLSLLLTVQTTRNAVKKRQQTKPPYYHFSKSQKPWPPHRARSSRSGVVIAICQFTCLFVSPIGAATARCSIQHAFANALFFPKLFSFIPWASFWGKPSLRASEMPWDVGQMFLRRVGAFEISVWSY